MAERRGTSSQLPQRDSAVSAVAFLSVNKKPSEQCVLGPGHTAIKTLGRDGRGEFVDCHRASEKTPIKLKVCGYQRYRCGFSSVCKVRKSLEQIRIFTEHKDALAQEIQDENDQLKEQLRQLISLQG